MNKRIIINADDFGVVPSINEAISDAVLAGKVNSVAAFSNYDYALDHVQKLVKDATAQEKNPAIGAHLTISSGRPITREARVPSAGLVDKHGNFKSFKEVSSDAIDAGVLYEELLAQVRRFTDNGVQVKHLSCHHNTLMFFDKLLRVYTQVAMDLGVRMRSVDIQPQGKNSFYMKVFLRMKLGDDNSRDDLIEMRNLVNNMKTRFSEYTNNAIKTPGYLESAYYGPLNPVMIRKSAIDAQIAQKVNDLNEIIERFGTSDYPSMELMLHLRKGDVKLFQNYKKEVEDTGYSGIDPTYFDSRLIEYRTLMEHDLSELFGKHGTGYGSWDEL
jgi:predicted glycoside hydrolase/deacetylase ChbG (UPF0249 family)